MIIGVPKEIKISEDRVGLTESGVRQLSYEGHTVLVERGAGFGSRISDENYEKAGAVLVDSAKDVYARSDDHKSKRASSDEYGI